MKNFKEIYTVNYDEVEKTYLNILNKITMEDIKSTNKFFNLKSKKTYVVIGGEEVYIKYFDLPRVKDDKLYQIINNELRYTYHNERSFIFSYRKIEEKDNKVKVIVFFVDSDNLKSIRKNMDSRTLKAVKMIQFCFIEYYKKIIKEDNFILCFSYKKDIYINAIEKGYMCANNLYSRRNKEIYAFYDYISMFIENKIDRNNFKDFYIVKESINDKKTIDKLRKDFKVHYLDEMSKSELMELIV